MFPVRIGTRSRWFLLEVENLFPDRFRDRKDGGGASVSALDLLKTSVYSWYSSGIAERSIFLEMVLDLACIVE